MLIVKSQDDCDHRIGPHGIPSKLLTNMYRAMGILIIELTGSGRKGCSCIDLIRREMRKEDRATRLVAFKAATIWIM